MKRQRCRSEEYRARRSKLKAKRRQRRDPTAQRGIFTQEDQAQLRAQAYEHGPFRLRDGWFVIVAGVQHGPWPDKGSASAGFDVERRRAAQRVLKEGETRVDTDTVKEAP